MLDEFGVRLAKVLDTLINTQIDIGSQYPSEEARLPEAVRQSIPAQWANLREICRDLELERSPETLRRLLAAAIQPEFTVGNYQHHLTQLDHDVRYDLGGLWFESVSKDKAVFYDAGFNDTTIDRAFNDASVEIKEAGTCYALGRNTASVFHLMRAVEYGLRATAVAVGTPKQKVPLDYEEWNKLIDLIDVQWKTAIDQWGKSAEQINARQFFKRIVADLHAFKDDVRNIIMHTRGTYDGPGALSVRNRVEAWFLVLASKVNEDMKSGEILNRALFM